MPDQTQTEHDTDLERKTLSTTQNWENGKTINSLFAIAVAGV
uniref:Uncharacterized protein n=1 Tax=Nelumbo nucifera TaxID=4432 RepID=A0A822YT50_NELNU|nr:TPA_asm: hypothetical protein HUJ06_007945 [Nelumbo nucifera]DAD37305.1 TPA_asm: hypothetical protein HUJ06_007946 [Nelumbo nucifera]